VFTNLAELKKAVTTKSEFPAEFSAKPTGFNQTGRFQNSGHHQFRPFPKKNYCFRQFLLTLRPVHTPSTSPSTRPIRPAAAQSISNPIAPA
jgi:hypothetical protein